MNQLATTRMLDVEPKMVLEIAYGVEEPAVVAERYGFSDSEWLLLKEHKPFITQVEEKKAELKATGYTFKMKAAIMAENLLDDLYIKATDPQASFHTILECVKFTARAAGYEQPAKSDQAVGPAISISIDLGGGRSVNVSVAQQPQNEVIDVTPESYDVELGEIPHYITSAHDALFMEAE